MSSWIVDCEQGSPAWLNARLGIPTASEFATVMAKGKAGGDSKTRRAYMLKLIGERITGEPMESYSNAHMERGKLMEAEARSMYCLVNDLDVQTVGFIRNEIAGASPDALVGNDGLLEIKTKLPHLQIEVLLSNEVPSEHIAQIQGQLWISGREWADFVSYWPGIKPFIKRVHRDQAYIDQIFKAVGQFEAELRELMERVK